MPTCSQPKCPIATTGVCLEGHKQGCPHVLADSDAPPEASEVSTGAPAVREIMPEPFRFHSGEKLSAKEASRLLSSTQVTMVLCAGPQWAGKTTFIARIGEMFRNGTFKDFRFAGSKTLCAFERVTWLATTESGVGQPDTIRTYRPEKDTFFHIQVQATAKIGKRIDLLITDLPGEIFPALLATKEICDEQLAVSRADHLVFFIDCGSIIDKAKRHSEKDGAVRFLSQVQKCRHEPVRLQVTIVFSRWDKITASDNQQEHEGFCEVIEDCIRERFASVFAGLCFDRIAARPDSAASQTNQEIQAIFGRWLDDQPSFPLATVSRTPKPARDFSAFGLT